MQLVSFHMGWPPPPRGWHVNRRPTTTHTTLSEGKGAGERSETWRPHPITRMPDEESTIRAELAIDYELYALVRERFWNAYAGMLNDLGADDTTFTAESAGLVPPDVVQSWLRRRYADIVAAAHPRPVTNVTITADDALCGEGWWWRSGWNKLDDRWTGPESRSSWLLPPLVPDQAYELTIDVLWPASQEVWDNTTLEINGQRVFVTRDRCEPAAPRAASHLLRATLSPKIVALQKRFTHVVLEIPETIQALKQFVVRESFDTYHPDERFVGLSVLGLRVRPI